MPESSPAELSSRLLVEGVGRPGPSSAVKAFLTCRALGSMKDPAARRKALETVQLPGRAPLILKQVHGVEIATPTGAGAGPSNSVPEADGWISAEKGVVLAVFVADCVPLFLWEKSGRAFGVFHAGWRGMAKGMPRRAVEAFRLRHAIEPGALQGAIGACIRECCFQVGPDTAEQFPSSSRIERDGKTFVDLARDASRQLQEAGVEDFLVTGGCTVCGAEKYFSFRREKSDNRMMAFITIDG